MGVARPFLGSRFQSTHSWRHEWSTLFDIQIRDFQESQRSLGRRKNLEGIRNLFLVLRN